MQWRSLVTKGPGDNNNNNNNNNRAAFRKSVEQVRQQRNK